MTPEEIEALRDFMQTNFASYLTNTLLHGVFVLLFAMSTVTIVSRGLKSLPAWAMLAITVISFLLSTLYWAANTAVYAILIQGTLIDNTELPFDTRVGVGFVAAFSPSFITVWTSLILPILSDIIVFWRAWVLFPQQQWVMIFPSVLLLGTTAVSIAFLGLAKDFSGLANTTDAALFDNLLLSSIILSMVTNAVCTLLISWKLWTHRKFMNNLGKQRHRSYIEKVLVVFIESGIFYCGLQMAALVLNLTPPVQGTARGYAEAVVYSIYTELSSMYPTVVVVLVNYHRSFVDTFGMSESPGNKEGQTGFANVTGHLSFAVPPTDSTLDTGNSLTIHSGRDTEAMLDKEKDDNGVYGRQIATAPF